MGLLRARIFGQRRDALAGEYLVASEYEFLRCPTSTLPAYSAIVALAQTDICRGALPSHLQSSVP